ncbi:hypothetical protein [Lentzea sp. NPDC092896]|uniref:hypothetical protein n=1 Tax=Lentzea sp. NPDC092896 TaxID=3364127 RepID=UPI00382A2ABF
MDPLLQHYASSIVRQLSLRRMLFVQATGNFEDSQNSVFSAIQDIAPDATGLPTRLVRTLENSDLTSTPHTIMLTDLELIADSANASWLAHIRPTFVDAVEHGSLLLIFSRVPRLRLAVTAGSLVSMDCPHYRFKKPDQLSLDELMTNIKISDRKNIEAWSQGQPTLLRQLVNIARIDISNRKKLARSDAALRETAFRIFSQLGPDISTWLEHWVCQYDETPDKSDIPGEILEALTEAGLASTKESTGSIDLLPGPGRDIFLRALHDYIDSIVVPPERWPNMSASLFRLERMIRLAVKHAYVNKFGESWKQNLPVPCFSKAVSRALQEAPRHGTAETIPNPLEWMTLGELASAVETYCDQHGPLGEISQRVWKSLFQEVEPVRNRAAHMRLMKYGDAEIPRRWIRELKMRAPAAFSSQADYGDEQTVLN